ncbi:hypothetical protein MCAV_06440 [[Mycoplasma] cavipharyngis]|uniref:hypothetical protein n=1 Tax=[Mycoplasma] cavipharyngis TaxID=92757 RepID=UPI0037038A7E
MDKIDSKTQQNLKNKQQNQTKNNLDNNPIIVSGQVFKIEPNGCCYVYFDGKIGRCCKSQISEFEQNADILKLNGRYSFMVLNGVKSSVQISKTVKVNFYWNLSYKQIHPEEIAKKFKPIPTMRHFQSLNQALNHWLSKKCLIKTKKTIEPIDFETIWSKKYNRTKKFCCIKKNKTEQ